MFATQFGKKLESLCQSVVPGHEIAVGDFIDLYFGITQDFEIPWLGDVDGTMDLLAVVRQACESQNLLCERKIARARFWIRYARSSRSHLTVYYLITRIFPLWVWNNLILS